MVIDSSQELDASLRPTLAVAILGVGVILAVPSLVTAFGLAERKQWARPVGLVAAGIALLAFPFGTAVSVLTFWLLLTPSRNMVEYSVRSSVSDSFR